ncbi:MAG TPA: outer-membrane lipoprotein carrier protein LolA [Hyphomicrobiaceae bacterium]|nr:outer-membrane lipoprotein carrier protein LolA [Hyphomicrobiaceae bacterium]
MGILRTWGVAAVGLSLAVASGGQGMAQQAKGANAADPVEAAWPAMITNEQGDGTTLSKEQIEAVNRVSAYFNGIDTLKGSFLQTDPDKKQAKGKFYVKRPGLFRFDYGAPTKKVMISDGRFLAIQDPDLQNPDTFELDQTPFRLLLRKDVDLMRDARIVDVKQADDLIVVALQDKSPDAPGKIQLFLSTKPEVTLREWVITDAQGLETRVEVSDLDRSGVGVDPRLFVRDNPALKKL